MNKETHHKNIVDYYVGSEVAYKEGWDLTKSMAIHYGYWDERVSSFKQSLLRTNEVMADIAKITKADVVLDAGCGVGGSAIYLAQSTDCEVTGITLTPRQVELAKSNAKKCCVSAKTFFEIRDYTNTGYKEASFDVVWALESVCHSLSKEDFVKEAFRLLKPGGRLIMADYFHTKPNFSIKEKEILKNWFKGWSLPHLDHIDRLSSQLSTLGMTVTHSEEATDKIMNSANRMYYFSIASKLYTRLLSIFGIQRKNNIKQLNGQGAYWQKKALNRGLWKYYIVCAIKS